MKVLIFMSQFYQLGGAERLAIELAEELNKRCIHTDILSMYTEELPGVEDARKDLLERGIPNIYFLGMKVHPPLLSLIPAILKLRSLIQEEGYDIIETSSISPAIISTWATSFGHARHISGLHKVFKRDRENSWHHILWRFSVRCNCRVRYYAITDYVNRAWTRYSNTPFRYTCTIHNAILNNCFNAIPDRQGVRSELEIPNDCRIIMYVGRLDKDKGCDILFEAMAPILEPNNLYLLYVGMLDPAVPGAEEMLYKMKNQIVTEGLGDRIRFLGYRKDIPRLMAAADVLAHPTKIEGFGLTLIEAMAAGLPVVTTNVEGIPEVLDGTESIMVAPNDPHVLRVAILKALNRMPEEATRVLEKGRKRAECFRIDRRVDAFVNLFDEILSGRF